MTEKMATEELLKKYGFGKLDAIEYTRGEAKVKVPYPKPTKKFRLVYQSFQQSIEEIYFWILTHMREDFGLHEVKKITDVFSASEQSSLFGASQQRSLRHPLVPSITEAS